MFQSSKRH